MKRGTWLVVNGRKVPGKATIDPKTGRYGPAKPIDKPPKSADK